MKYQAVINTIIGSWCLSQRDKQSWMQPYRSGPIGSITQYPFAFLSFHHQHFVLTITTILIISIFSITEVSNILSIYENSLSKNPKAQIKKKLSYLVVMKTNRWWIFFNNNINKINKSNECKINAIGEQS